MRGVLSDDSIQELVADIASSECLGLKGVLAIGPLLVHASSKSQLEMPRRVLHIEYATSMNIAAGLELATA